ncbi:hypothetical protein CM15mP43_06430 [bacterium]|nr:MAG: hypothetical protein CM15mP43_06430 [bacterium]
MDKEKKSLLTQILVLFASSSTLVCCALPALLVAIGATGALISLFSNIPFLITISENKEIVFYHIRLVDNYCILDSEKR